MPIEPPASDWSFDVDLGNELNDFVATGADDAPGTLLAAYRRGLFPMPSQRSRSLGWWSPNPRGILELDALHVSRSLRRSLKRFEFRINTAFPQVMDGCADRSDGNWIDDRIKAAYLRLHELGWAHSVETWRDGQLVGGLYGIALGGLFAAESKFHRVTDASKAAVVALVAALSDDQDRLIDVQWRTPHLATLGVTEVSRPQYLARLPALLATPPAGVFASREARRLTHPLTSSPEGWQSGRLHWS